MICAGITKAGNIITVDYVAGDGTRGASWSDPYRLVDILDTSVANGWGVTVQSGTDFSHYFIPYRVTIEGADTYALIQEEGVMIETTESYAFYVSGANFRSITSAALKPHNIISSSSYKQFHIYNNAAGTSLIQDTIFNNFNIFRARGDITFQRVCFEGVSSATIPYTVGDGITFEDIVISMGGSVFTPFGDFVSASRIKIQYSSYGIVIGYGNLNISNLQIQNCDYDLRLLSFAAGIIANLTDCEVDVTSTRKGIVGNGDVTLNLLSTFKINITNGDGGTATLYDQFGNVVATQTLSGEWEVAGKVLYYKRYYEVTDGVESADEITEYFPFSLVVTKAGKQTLTVPGINIEAGEITHVRAGMIDVLEYTEALIEGTIDEENFDFEFKEEEFTFELD